MANILASNQHWKTRRLVSKIKFGPFNSQIRHVRFDAFVFTRSSHLETFLHQLRDHFRSPFSIFTISIDQINSIAIEPNQENMPIKVQTLDDGLVGFDPFVVRSLDTTSKKRSINGGHDHC